MKKKCTAGFALTSMIGDKDFHDGDCPICGGTGWIEVDESKEKEKKRRWAYGKHYTGKAKEDK